MTDDEEILMPVLLKLTTDSYGNVAHAFFRGIDVISVLTEEEKIMLAKGESPGLIAREIPLDQRNEVWKRRYWYLFTGLGNFGHDHNLQLIEHHVNANDAFMAGYRSEEEIREGECFWSFMFRTAGLSMLARATIANVSPSTLSKLLQIWGVASNHDPEDLPNPPQ